MDKATRPNFAIFIVVLALALVGLIYGITHHSEPGLIKTCRNETTGEATYKGDCFELTWAKRGPLVVNTTASDTTIAKEIVAETNDLFGCKVFVFSSITADRDVLVMFDTIPVRGELPSHGGAVTTHYLNKEGQAVSARVKVANLALEYDVFRATIHELGHVVGLAHDDFSLSIMRDPPAEGSVFTDDDKETICSRLR